MNVTGALNFFSNVWDRIPNVDIRYSLTEIPEGISFKVATVAVTALSIGIYSYKRFWAQRVMVL